MARPSSVWLRCRRGGTAGVVEGPKLPPCRKGVNAKSRNFRDASQHAGAGTEIAVRVPVLPKLRRCVSFAAQGREASRIFPEG
jgi:hypothetical protein